MDSLKHLYVPTVEHLTDALAYLVWADRRSVEVARSVPADAYQRDLQFSWGSVHKILVHMMCSQAAWIQRLNGNSPKRIENHTDYPTLASVEARWPAVHEEYRVFIATQTPATLAAELQYLNSSGNPDVFPVGDLLLHIFDHATYHRGQLNSMAKLTGGTPLPIMRIPWMDERPVKDNS